MVSNLAPAETILRRARFFGTHAPRDKENQLARPRCDKVPDYPFSALDMSPRIGDAPEAVMSDDWEFSGADDAKAEIRAAVGYLLRGATGGARGDIVQAIISIVRQVAAGLPPE